MMKDLLMGNMYYNETVTQYTAITHVFDFNSVVSRKLFLK